MIRSVAFAGPALSTSLIAVLCTETGDGHERTETSNDPSSRLPLKKRIRETLGPSDGTMCLRERIERDNEAPHSVGGDACVAGRASRNGEETRGRRSKVVPHARIHSGRARLAFERNTGVSLDEMLAQVAAGHTPMVPWRFVCPAGMSQRAPSKTPVNRGTDHALR